MSTKGTSGAPLDLGVLDQIGDVERALSDIAGPLHALAAFLESNVEVDEEVQKGLATILRGLSELSRRQIPTLRAVTGSLFGRRKGETGAAE